MISERSKWMYSKYTRFKFTWRAVLLLALGVFLMTGLLPTAAAADGGERLVLAFYYNWFDENSWGPNKVPDRPAETYVSRDRAAMGRHIDQAKVGGYRCSGGQLVWSGGQQPDRHQPARHAG